MSRPLLRLDADASNKSLHTALVNLGHDVTRTPNDLMPLDASDEVQLLGAMGASTFGRNIILVLQKSYYMVHLKKSIRQKWMLPGQSLKDGVFSPSTSVIFWFCLSRIQTIVALSWQPKTVGLFLV